jgi:glycosyltransferase involved in cell wall biosynthesis
MNLDYIKSKVVNLYSPVPPIKSGTANYFSYALDEIKSRNPDKVFNIVVNKRDYTAEIPIKIKECFVIDAIECDNSDHNILFIANNKWHKYCHRALARFDQSTQFSLVIHEPCCFMIVKEMCVEGYFPYCPQVFSIINSIDLGIDNNLPNDYFIVKRKNIHYSLEYNAVGLHWNINNATRIFVHSEFAATKISVDRKISRTRFSVYKHPKTIKSQGSKNSINKTINEVRFGIFGWIQKSKQTREIVKAFIDFLQRIPDKKSTSLYIVGEISDPVNYNPYDWVPKCLLKSKNIIIKGYLNDDEFDSVMSSMDAVVSLRYPSCGETSGVVEKSQSMGIKVIGNDYNAFSEEAFDYKVPTEIARLHDSLAEVMVQIYNKKTHNI